MRFFAVALMAASLALGLAQPAGAQSGAAACSIQVTFGTATCYAPAQVAQAERQVPFAVRPSAAVARTMHMSLSQVMVWTTPAPQSRKSITYIYGVLVPGGDYGRTPAQPKSIVIREDRGRANLQAQYLQRFHGVAMEVSQAALNHPYRTYGPWYLNANFPQRNLTLSITANLDQATLKQLAYRILQAG
jgi:hypothetical protein